MDNRARPIVFTKHKFTQLLSEVSFGHDVRRGCDLEIVNLSPRVEKLVSLTKLDLVFSKMKGLF